MIIFIFLLQTSGTIRKKQGSLYMEILNVILQLVLVFVGWFIITYVKKLPDQVHAKNLKKIEHDLNTQLEEFRNKLTTT